MARCCPPLDQAFAFGRLHNVFYLVVIQHGAELTNDLFNVVTYPRLADAVWCGLIHGDLKNWPPVITELIQHAHDNRAVSLFSTAVSGYQNESPYQAIPSFIHLSDNVLISLCVEEYKWLDVSKLKNRMTGKELLASCGSRNTSNAMPS